MEGIAVQTLIILIAVLLAVLAGLCVYCFKGLK